MANTISNECINCAACEPVCPNQAISEGDDYYVIDAAKCDECAKDGGEHKCIEVCPVDGCITKVAA